MQIRRLVSRALTWPVFLGLAIVHLAVLPLVLQEHEDDVLAVIAGVAYLGLALLDIVVSRRRRAGSPVGGGTRARRPLGG